MEKLCFPPCHPSHHPPAAQYFDGVLRRMTEQTGTHSLPSSSSSSSDCGDSSARDGELKHCCCCSSSCCCYRCCYRCCSPISCRCICIAKWSCVRRMRVHCVTLPSFHLLLTDDGSCGLPKASSKRLLKLLGGVLIVMPKSHPHCLHHSH